MLPEDRDAAYLWDILDVAKTVVEFTTGLSLHDYLKDRKLQLAIEREIEIIGEAAKNIPPSVQALIPEVDWRKPAGLRDVIAHAYFGIDDTILWDVVQNKVPELQQAIDLFNKREKK